MHYDPVTPVENIFKNVEDLREYVDMVNFPYLRPQAVPKAYNIINKTVNFQESIKSQNRLSPIQKIWITFKTHSFVNPI